MLDVFLDSPLREAPGGDHWRRQPRDDFGRWRDTFMAAARGLRAGRQIDLPDGSHVKAFEMTGGRVAAVGGPTKRVRFAVGDERGRMDRGAFDDPEEAARYAIERSAKRSDPRSLGGSTSYRSVRDAEEAGARFGEQGEELRGKFTREARADLEAMAVGSEKRVGRLTVKRETKTRYTLNGEKTTATKAATQLGLARETERRLAEPVDFNARVRAAMNTDPIGRNRILRGLADDLKREGRTDEERDIRARLARYEGVAPGAAPTDAPRTLGAAELEALKVKQVRDSPLQAKSLALEVRPAGEVKIEVNGRALESRWVGAAMDHLRQEFPGAAERLKGKGVTLRVTSDAGPNSATLAGWLAVEATRQQGAKATTPRQAVRQAAADRAAAAPATAMQLPSASRFPGTAPGAAPTDPPRELSRMERAREHAKAKAPGGRPSSSDVAVAMMNAEQHATVDALRARKNMAEVSPSEAVQGDSGDVRFWYRRRYSNGKAGPAQKATIKPDGRVVNAYGEELFPAPADELVKKAAAKVVLR